VPSSFSGEDIMEMKSFLQSYDEIETSLGEAQERVSECERCSRRLLDSTTDEELAEEELRMNALIKYIDDNCSRNRSKLDAVRRRNEELETVAPPGSGDLRMRRIKTAALASKFADLISRFQEVQVNSRAENRDLIERQYRLSKFVHPQA